MAAADCTGRPEIRSPNRGRFAFVHALLLAMAVVATDPAGAAELTADEVRALLAAATLERPADLSGRDLTGLDLSELDFKRAVLSGADLYGTKLVGANFSGAKLHAARIDLAWIM